MPELPEVETVVRDLRPLLTGRKIVGVRKSKQKLRHAWKPEWDAAVTGAKVTGLRRRGKWILVDLDTPNPTGGGPKGDHTVLVVHLGMTGQFTAVPATESEPDHLHLVFELDRGKQLRFRDPRRFGSVEYHPSAADADYGLDAFLGWEPFDIDPEEFRQSLALTRQNLKAVLLNQAFVAGVGNIYADEALFRARLHPARPGSSLTADECDRLREAIAAVMTRAIETRGSTIRDYIGGSGLRGGFQNEHAVYGRTGEPCPVCRGAVACVRLAGRSSHFCPQCQPREGAGRAPRPRASPRGS
ncbi:MAG TPA: bifunctional DNA-formamidopyrimidine glycosylase/DNA-(apurinic or apyrimidinic site) lyase [Gemmata sp.]|nr:bifunctional DNA-formamidopyrimidine glycosylase/DNA-(apurinic or apyrimidinic site) lyase [Gemmata sp.]